MPRKKPNEVEIDFQEKRYRLALDAAKEAKHNLDKVEREARKELGDRAFLDIVLRIGK